NINCRARWSDGTCHQHWIDCDQVCNRRLACWSESGVRHTVAVVRVANGRYYLGGCRADQSRVRRTTRTRTRVPLVCVWCGACWWARGECDTLSTVDFWRRRPYGGRNQRRTYGTCITG